MRGRPLPSKQTRHVAPAPSPGATGELSGRTERERDWRRQWTPDGDCWESPGLGWPSRLEADEGSSGRGCMCAGSGRHPRRLKRRHERKETRGNGRDPVRSAECSAAVRVGIRRGNAEVPPDASWEVGGDHGSEEGVDTRTRRSDGSLLESCFRWGRGGVHFRKQPTRRDRRRSACYA